MKIDTTRLRPEQEEKYAELTYEAKLAYEAKDAETRIDALNERLQTEYCDETPKKNDQTKIRLSFEVEPCGNPEPAPSDVVTPKQYKHPQTIKEYVAVVLSLFSNIETETVKNGEIQTKKLPVFYGSFEKQQMLEQHQTDALFNGNTNTLPRAFLTVESVVFDASRQINKSLNVASKASLETLKNKPYAEVMPAPAPYNIALRLSVQTRGVDDAFMIVEQIASRFTPHYNILMFEHELLQEQEVRLKLESVTFEPPEFEEFSANEITTEFEFTLYGNLYRAPRKEFLVEKINLNIV